MKGMSRLWTVLSASEVQPRKRRALENAAKPGVFYSGSSDRPCREIQFSQTPIEKSRWYSHEEWLAERAQYAVLVIGNCTEVNPRKRGGVPVLKGTRFTLAQVLAEIAEGRSIAELAEDFELDLELLKAFLEGMAICLDRPFYK